MTRGLVEFRALRHRLAALCLVALGALRCVTAQDLGAARLCARDDAGLCDLVDASTERCVSPGETRACYAGPAVTRAVGRCRDGVTRCDPLRGRFSGACEGEEGPAPVELCANAIDDDCDGVVDEDCAAPRLAQVAVGDHTSCALAREREGARVVCWGDGASGLFGATGPPRTRPERVAAPVDTVAIAMGASHLCALARGEVWCIGRNDDGELGDGTTAARATFVRVAGVPAVTALVAGRHHTCARTTEGAVWCWGADGLGQTGDATSAATPCARGGARGCQLRPHPIAGLGSAQELSAGFAHTCARVDGDAWCWGDGRAFRRVRPRDSVAVGAPERALVGVTRVVAGGGSTCAFREGVAPTCRGRLGALTEPLGDGGAVVAGGARWCVASAGASLRCTNDGWWDAPDRESAEVTPLALAEVSTTEATQQMAIGISHACALWGDRTVRCWGGDNAYGELGVGTAETWTEPLVDVAW